MRLLGGIVAMAIVGALACSTPSGNGKGCDSTGASSVIDARDNQSFSNTSVTISKGQKVCWQNVGTITHTITADPTPDDSTWNANNVNQTLTPDFVVLLSFGTVGNFPYHCFFHSGMRGVISVR